MCATAGGGPQDCKDSAEGKLPFRISMTIEVHLMPALLKKQWHTRLKK